MDSVSSFPLHKLKLYKYLMIDIMMHVEHKDVCKYMFALNKEARAFIQQNYNDIRNGFINEGLIDFHFNKLNGPLSN